MQPTILVAEDDKYLSKLLFDTLSDQKYTVKTALDGQAALKWLEKESFSLVVLDLLLPRVMGQQIAKVVREKSPSTPILFVSGVYKSSEQIDELKSTIGGCEFLPKPFNVDQLLEIVRRQIEKPSVAPVLPSFPPAGTLDITPVSELLVQIYFSMETGILTLERGSFKRRLFFSSGFPVFATSTSLQETLGAMLRRKNLVSNADLDAASREMVEKGSFLGEILIERKLITTDEFYRVLREQIYDILLNAFSWTDGTYQFERADQFDQSILQIEFNPVLLIARGVGKFLKVDEFRESLSDFLDGQVIATPRFTRLFPLLNLVEPLKSKIEVIPSSPRLERFLDDEPTLKMLAVLKTAGMIEIRVADSIHPAAPRDSQTGTVVQSDLAKTVTAAYVQAMAAQPHELLKVDKSVTVEELSKAYQLRLKEFHVDNYSGAVNGEIRRMLNEIVGKIDQAYQTIRDQKLPDESANAKRKYDSAAEAKLYLDAQELVREAEGFATKKEFDKASDRYAKAYSMWNKAPEYHLNALYTRFLHALETAKDRDKAKLAFSEFLAEENTYISLDTFYLLSGHMHLRLGNIEEAKRAYQQALHLNPHSEEIERALQSIGIKSKKQGGAAVIADLSERMKPSRRVAALMLLWVAALGFGATYLYVINPDPTLRLNIDTLRSALPVDRASKIKSTVEIWVDGAEWAQLTAEQRTERMNKAIGLLEAPPSELIVYDRDNRMLAMSINGRAFFYDPK